MWSLRLGFPFEPLSISYVVEATLPDGSDAVLKIAFREPESEYEGDALAHWSGEGAVRMLARDNERHALLLERCVPGTSLWELPEEDAVEIGARVLQRLWRPAPEGHSYRLVADEAVGWAERLPRRWEELGRLVERSVVEQALAALRELPASQEELVVCHQDIQGSNVLRAEREPWLAIDPKPIVGERAFDTATFLRDRRWELTAATVRRRLDRLSDELGLDRERMRGWGIAHALAWDQVESARLLAAA